LTGLLDSNAAGTNGLMLPPAGSALILLKTEAIPSDCKQTPVPKPLSQIRKVIRCEYGM
jgi:hypothetical protein